MKRLSVIVLLLGLICAPFSAYAFDLGVRGYYWVPVLDGHMKADLGGIIGTDIDFVDDLDMEDENYPMVEAFVGLGDHLLSVSAMEVDYSGSEILAVDITFNGVDFTATTDVDSSLKYQMIDAEYRWNLIDLENILAGFSIGVIGKIKYVDGEAEIKSLTLDEKVSFNAPIPMVGASVHVGLIADLLEVRAKVAGIGYSGNTLYDAMADVSFTPFPLIDIHGGYRIIDLDVDIDDVELRYTMSGPYLAVTVGF